MSNKLISAMPVEREGRVVGNLAIKAAAEPPVGQVEIHLFTHSLLGADGKAIAENEHPDHQLRINRGTDEEHAHLDKNRKIAAPVRLRPHHRSAPFANHKENESRPLPPSTPD